ncbi:hypothetical protein A8F94_13530 [Bacillus sp. FJAT-27225]|uniref:DMT family transporter n=1 Tax=Bacillus sp. FJAT-27225 TaxID=1743144 RepID=UPI00080C25EB|nr:DMT family transporter [Bacillus sp. FJAT-27225]OCA85875.1 hypothetical protein A8F94_13530 [Bacillus sp. FJAT-27225]
MGKGRAILVLKLCLVGVMWGASFNAGNYIVKYVPPLGAASIRFIIATFCMAILVLASRRMDILVVKQNLKVYLIMGVVGIFGFNALFFLGLMKTSSVNGALIMGTNPLVTVFLSWLILKASINKIQVTGFLLSLVGVIIVISEASLDNLVSLTFSIGDMYILIGNVFWAFFGVIGKMYLKDSPAIITTAVTLPIGTSMLVLAAIALPNQYPNPIDQTPVYAWLLLLFLGIGASFLSNLWWNSGIKNLGANTTSIFYNLAPASSIVISYIAGETVLFGQIIGCIIIILGVSMVLVFSPKVRIPKSTKECPGNCI